MNMEKIKILVSTLVIIAFTLTGFVIGSKTNIRLDTLFGGDGINTLLQFLEVFGVLGATYFAFKSVKIARETAEETKKQNDPHIVVFVRQQPTSINILDLVVKNEGRKSAQDVTFEVNMDLELNLTVGKRKLSDMSMLQNGLSLLSGGEERANPISIFLGEEYKKLREANIIVKVAYRNSEGNMFSENFRLEFRGLVDRKIGNDWTEELVKVLKEMHKDLSKIKNNLYDATHKLVPLHSEPHYKNEMFRETEKLEENENTTTKK